MSQLDGTRISKPTAPSLTPSRPQKTHRCCGRLFASPPSREKARDDFYGDEEISEDDAPMRIVSPRVTDTVPVAPAPKTKKKSVSLKSTSKSTDEASMVTACEGEKADERNLALEGDSAMASPARDAALTSHPVHATDTGGETA